ncbi:MAG: TonB-dependent receptor [Chitinophagaceae bacterium]|nr:TonB-dependent receptor [Chitinophagaceae bacterium]
MIIRMKKTLVYFCCLFFLFFNLQISDINAQSIKVTGKVVSTDGRGLELATITLKGSKDAAVTNAEGVFSINANKSSTLIFSAIGYKSVEALASAAYLLISLEPITDDLDQVVVVGYSRQKKVNLTGAVSVISGAELAKRPVFNTTVALQGALPGVTVTQFNGVPGSNAEIRIRGIGTLGNNDPLILVDGVVAAIGDIDPNNIESMSVLKDASSASIYGSRAAGGVILITSKRGKSGGMKVDYDAFYGVQQPVDKPNYLGSVGFMNMYNEALTNEGGAAKFTPDYIASYMDNNAKDPDHYPNTDWQKATFTNGIQQQHNITLNGGTDKIKILAALNYMNQNGIVNNSGFNRYSLRLNTDYKASEKLDFQFDMNLRRDNTILPAVGYSELFRQVYRVPPIYAAKYSDGSWGPGWEGGNPLSYSEASGINSTTGVSNLINLQANYKPLKGLTINFNYAPKFATSFAKNNQKRVEYFNFDSKALLFANPTKNTLSNSNANSLNNYLRLQAAYTKDFDWLNFNVLVGAEQTDNTSQNFSASREATLFPELEQLDNYPALNQNSSGDASSWALRSYYGRMNLVASDKYLLEINSRYDGSSRFSEEYKRFGLFPSFSAGWIMSKENFMRNIKWLSLLKLRASWGTMGNQNIGTYPYISSVILGSGVFNGNIVSVAAQNTLANRKITWESTTVKNVGLNAAFLQNKLNIDFDYYEKMTDDILLTLPIPLIVGMSAGVQNAGSVENKGWDLQISYNDQIGKDFKYGITGVFSDVRNKVINLKGTGPYISGFQITQVGEEIGSLYGLQAAGLFQTQSEITASATQYGTVKPGDIKYIDQNKDGVINASDRVIIGSRIPRNTYSANVFLDYKGFSLSLFFQGVSKYNGLQIQDAAWAFYNAGGVRDIHLDRWSTTRTPEENLKATYPRFFISQTNNQQTSSYWVDDASYIKLKTVSIGYSLPASFLRKTPFSMFKIYASGQNVISWDKVPGYDPEAPLGNPFNYPQVASFVTGVRLSLK